MSKPQVLIVGPDESLVAELTPVLRSLDSVQPVARHVDQPSRAGEAARSWRPDVVMLEMDGDLDGLRVVAREIQAASPESCLVGVFRNDLFAADGSESAMLIQAIRLGVQDFIRRPVSRNDVVELFERLLTQSPQRPAAIGKLVSFISNKGGVGKTTLAVNSAVELARRFPDRVLLIDCSLQMGVCAALLHLRPATSILDAARERRRLDETLLRQLTIHHESGLDLLAAPANAIEATEVDEEIIARLLALARRSYDYVVVDTFPMFDRIVMSVLDVSDRAHIVLDNLVPTVLGASQLIKVLDSLSYASDRQAVVISRAMNVLGGLRPPDIEARLGRQIDFVVPYEKQVMTAANIGRPFVSGSGWFSRARRAMREVAAEIVALQPDGETPSGADRRHESQHAAAIAPALTVSNGARGGNVDG